MNQPTVTVRRNGNGVHEGHIKYNDGAEQAFSALSPHLALRKARSLLDTKSLTRRVLDKLHVEAIFFNGRKIYPWKRVRTKDPRHDRKVNGNRTSCPKVERVDLGRRKHPRWKIGRLLAA
ncbi:MAG: hypothetical protein WC767_02930 [Candidatus Paceibacterota bacterium]|jgi:hypothetical protein